MGENGDYGIGVILDTKLFDNVKPRNLGRVLSNYVYSNLAGAELEVYDESGRPEMITLARENDSVKKDDAKSSHKVLDKLARYNGNNIRALKTVQMSEALLASRYENTTDEHTHQWMDENGWEHRKVYLQDISGNIYQATLNIANGRDRRILYDINMVRQIDKKRTPGGAVPSTKMEGARSTSRSSVDNVAQPEEEVKGLSLPTIEDYIAERDKVQEPDEPESLKQFRYSADDQSVKPANEADALRREISRLSDKAYQQGVFDSGGIEAIQKVDKKIKKYTARLEKLGQQEASAPVTPAERKTAAGKEQTKAPGRPGETKPVAKSDAIIAKKELRQTLTGLFSTPEGSKAELGKAIDQIADRIIQTGELTERDRTELFDRLYATGEMLITAAVQSVCLL